jgi:hypothetical protein
VRVQALPADTQHHILQGLKNEEINEEI